jgi:tRNA uridine 5-carboxymethylaminomethyl modification enzyme
LPGLTGLGGAAAEQVEIEVKYEGYIRRQDEEIAKVRRHASIMLPADLSYDAVDGLSHELRHKLSAARPETLARAARIPGMTPAALSLLLVYARRTATPEQAAERAQRA